MELRRLDTVWFRLSLGAILLALLVGPAFAQRLDGGLTGEVTDQTGAVVAGAKVTVTNEATGVSVSTATTSAGTYIFPNLLVGSYTLKVEGKGFAPYARKNVGVSSNQVAEVHVKMAVGAEQTTVEVTAGAAVIDTTTSQVSNTFGASTVINLPTASGNILDLATLAPNTTTQGGGVLGSGGSIGGARPRMNNFSVDGVDDNDQSVTGPLSTVVQDAVAEFTLLTNQFSAEYGHSGAGQFNIITKSGTNEWHGSAYHWLRNRKLNALDNLQKQSLLDGTITEKPRFDYNNLSGTVGGPIMKNKLFIFGAFQYSTRGRGVTSASVDAPTAAGLATLKSLAANASVRQILDQFPVAGNQTSTLDVTDKLSESLLATIPIGSVNFAAPDFFNEYDFHINGDYNTDKHRLSTRYLYNRYRAPNLPYPALPQFSGFNPYDVRKATITDAWTVNNSLINDFRLGYTRQMAGWTVPEQFANFPNVTVLDMVNFTIGPEGNSPQNGGQNTYQLLDQLVLSKGKHTLKFGGEWRHWISPSNFLPRARGDWWYTELGELIRDYHPSDFAKRGAGDGSFSGNQNALYWFFQDDLKLTSRLTLNLGLRYEWNGVSRDSAKQTLNAISNLPGVFDFRKPKSDTNNFGPRLGFAWDPTGNAKWSVRGGFGMAYDVNFTNLALLQLPPQLQSEQDPDVTCALPGRPAWCASYLATGTGVNFLAGGGLLQVNVPPANQAEARASTGGIIVDNVAPRIMTYSLGVQRELTSKTSIEVRYLGTRADSLPVQVQANSRTAFNNGAQALTTWFSTSSIPATLPLTTPTLAQFNAKAVRPYAAQGFAGAVTAFYPWGESSYNSASVDFTHRLNRGLYLRANYTFAKTIDDSTNELNSSAVNPRRPEDGFNVKAERGRSTLDIRQKLALSWTYELPKLATENPVVKRLMHGWQVNGAYIAQTGQPVTALSFLDANGNKDTAGDRAIVNANGDPRIGSAIDSVYMNPTTGATCLAGAAGCVTSGAGAFPVVGYVARTPNAGLVRAGVGTRTNVGRNTLDTPGLNNWDIGLFKNTHITETKYIQFRFEMFNAFNHRQFSFANSGISGLSNAAQENVSYSQVYSSAFLDAKELNGGARSIQLGLKVVF